VQTCISGFDGLPGFNSRFGHGFDIISNGLYQVRNNQTMQTLVNQMQRFAHG